MTDCFKCHLSHPGPYAWCQSCRDKADEREAREEAERAVVRRGQVVLVEREDR